MPPVHSRRPPPRIFAYHSAYLLLSWALCSCILCHGSTTLPNPLFAPPLDAASQPAWLAALKAQREQIKQKINYSGAVYSDPAVNWTRLSFVQPQIHVYDKYLYDYAEHRFTVDKYLDDLKARYGGIDSVLLWPTYTNIGIDARNQFDYYRAIPGGLEALTNVTAAFKKRGVRVLWGYNPWDQGTRLEPNSEPHWKTLADLLKKTGGDGFNGDTMNVMYKEFWDAGVAADYHIVGEMEDGGYPVTGARPEDDSYESSQWSTMGWGYFYTDRLEDNITTYYEIAPGIDKLKWLDGRRMTHVCDRWAKNRTEAMQYAFFNGVGYESWENVWAVFMHMTPRDGEALRRMATLLRWLGEEAYVQDYEDWEPFTPDVVRPPTLPFSLGGPMGSRFTHKSGDCAWLVVNRASIDAMFELDLSKCPAYGRSCRVFDLYHGVELLASEATQSLEIEANGFASVLCTNRFSELRNLSGLLQEMSNLTKAPLSSYSSDWKPLPQQQHPSKSALDAYKNSKTITGGAATASPEGMVEIPKTTFRFHAAGTEIEGGCEVDGDDFGVCCRHGTTLPDALTCPRDEACRTPCGFHSKDDRGVDVQFPWETVAARFHDRNLELGPFFIDKHLVTKGDFAKYLNATGYKPRDAYNFLVGWTAGENGTLKPPAGEQQQPVVWVSLNESRAYCEWAGKRLPHVYEWQLAAQGPDAKKIYPWGDDPDEEGAKHPKASASNDPKPLPEVGNFSPQGDSVYGVADLVGLVWQYTDEFSDDHTRTVLLKGSSAYAPMLSADFPALPQVGNWYFPHAPQVNRHGRMMLMDDSYERAGTLGFRCAADHPEGQPAPYHFRDIGPSALKESGSKYTKLFV